MMYRMRGDGTYGEVVEVWKEEQNADESDEAEDDTAHWGSAAS